MCSLDSPLFTAPQAALSQAIDSFATEIQSAKVLLPARFPFSTTSPKIDPQTELHVETRVLIPSVFGANVSVFRNIMERLHRTVFHDEHHAVRQRSHVGVA